MTKITRTVRDFSEIAELIAAETMETSGSYLAAFDSDRLQAFLHDSPLVVTVDGESHELAAEDLLDVGHRLGNLVFGRREDAARSARAGSRAGRGRSQPPRALRVC